MTFDGFADVWTPVLLRRRLGRRPVRLIVAGEPLALFRDRSGKVGALIDRRPHRGVALSLGRVTPEGTLECPFHGWRFDVAGTNRAVPLNLSGRGQTSGFRYDSLCRCVYRIATFPGSEGLADAEARE